MERAMSDYLQNLGVRDRTEQKHNQLITEFTKLAARTATAEHKLRALESSPSDPTSAPNPSADLLTHLRSELAAARSELGTTQATNAASSTRITTLEGEVTTLSEALRVLQRQNEAITKQTALLDRKLRDRHSESREGRKLVDDVQNEIIALELQLSLSEQKAERLERDNRELVERWMALKGVEAERMNRESRW